MPRKATFPNLPGLDMSAPPKSAPILSKPPRPDALKRRADLNGTDSESISSSHPSKRQKLSPEPSSESFHASALDGSRHHDCLILEPDILAMIHQRSQRILTANAAEKQSRQGNFEAALKRAIRRANEAEHRLQDASQDFAEKLKIKDDIHHQALEAIQQANTKALEGLRVDNEALRNENVTMTSSVTKDPLETTSEASSLRSALQQQEIQLAHYNHLKSALAAELQPFLLLSSPQDSAPTAPGTLLTTRHNELTTLIARQIDEFDEVSNKTLKRYAAEIQEANQAFVDVVQEVAKLLAGAEGVVERLLGSSRGVDGVDNSVNISTGADPSTGIGVGSRADNDSEANRNENENGNAGNTDRHMQRQALAQQQEQLQEQQQENDGERINGREETTPSAITIV